MRPGRLRQAADEGEAGGGAAQQTNDTVLRTGNSHVGSNVNSEEAHFNFFVQGPEFLDAKKLL
jgi:hypothetical protein